MFQTWTPKKPPPRDWGIDGVNYAIHFVEGVLTSVSFIVGMVYDIPILWSMSLSFLLMYFAYQIVENWAREDTPARDLSDFMLGWAVPAFVALSIWLWFPHLAARINGFFVF